MKLNYHLVNVFTHEHRALTGNPLCVFEDGSALSDGEMQALAIQFNLSETTFILPSANASAKVRIFTPGGELPFAGHPTLGTAHVVRKLGGNDTLTLEMKAGVIPVAAQGDCWTLTANPSQARAVDTPLDTLAAAVGVKAGDIGNAPRWVSTGTEQLIIPLRSEAAVRAATINAPVLNTIQSAQGRSMALVFCELGSDRVLSRFFFKKGTGFDEDPATGSACANLGGWYVAQGHSLPLKRVIAQGEYVHRPSTLLLNVDAHKRIHVGGEVIHLGAGSITP